MIRRFGWVPLAALLAAQAGHAQPVGFDEVLEAAREDLPTVQARGLEVEAMRNTASAADELPDPRLRGGLVNAPVTGPIAFELDGTEMTMLEVGIDQEIPNLAKRHARRGFADAETGLARARLTHARHNAAIEAGQAWVALAYAQRRHDLATERLEELRALVPVAQSAVTAGSARPAQTLEIRRSLIGVENALTSIEADMAVAQAQLRRYTSLEAPVAEGEAPPVELDPEQLRATLTRNPELGVSDAAQERASAAIDLARADKRPDFGVSVSYGRRDQQFGDMVSVMGSVTLPIFAGQRQNPRIAAAEAEAAAARAEREDRLRVLEAQFYTDLAGWSSAVQQWQRDRDELLPLARERADLETASYSAGRAGVLDVIAAKTALVLLELEILDREAAAVIAATRLRLTYREHGQ